METTGIRWMLSSRPFLMIHMRKSCMELLMPFGVNILIPIIILILLTVTNLSVVANIKGATVLYYLSVTFGLPILAQFPSDPYFNHRYPWFLLWNISSACYHRLSPFVAVDCTRGAQMRGGGEGSHGWKKIVCGCAHKIILVHNLSCQPEAQGWVLVRLLNPHRGLICWYQRIIFEYDLATTITIQPIMTGSSPRCPLRSHSLVCIKNHLFIVGIGKKINKELEFIFQYDRSDRTYVYS